MNPLPRSVADLRGLPLNLLLVVLFNSAIAALLWVLMPHSFAEQMIWSQSIGLSIFTAIHLLGGRREAGKFRLDPGLPTMVVAVLLGGAVGVMLGAWFSGHGVPWSDDIRTMALSFGLAFGFGAIGMLLFSAHYRMQDARLALAQAAAEKEAGERRLLQTRLKLIQAQIEPHFLFNTLSNVTALIDIDPDRARRMMELFTRYLRASLDRTRADGNTLADEAALLSVYLDIQAMRMGQRLACRLEIPEALRHVPLAPLLLQPLVENAIRHGIEPAPAGGEVVVRAESGEGKLRLSVEDTGAGFAATAPGNGIGLDNVQERLRLLYGKGARLVLSPRAPVGFVSLIEIPMDALKP